MRKHCGNPNGKPVVFVHGGPGAGCNPAHGLIAATDRFAGRA
ncbi:hypothetical protein [Saccharopolyspora sp. NPDC050642]